ncbi:cyclase family protein [Reichenbachiella carrageenanivorans]|uniref:Cyclase family protein n=1 Tax=Reichenbachiella carrageenanivorans TaxID=2979869 RepID=A0ABY6D5H2_9BACT|nr:cyclase family protein [Reichenbachiella carrageenanivorans]UXX79085.1 cyclase family protein [Reichenbachiella carrageenanivorans]
MLDLSKYIVHDLTHTLSDKIAGFSEKSACTMSVEGWNAKTLTIYSHAGTHMDAPFHFEVNEITIDQIRPDQLMGRAWVLDVPVTKPSQLIHLEDVEKQVVSVEIGDSLLFRTNWSSNYEQANYKTELPRLSKELSEWCVEKQIKMIGVEPLSVADVGNLAEVTEIHQLLLGGGITIIEGVAGLDKIIAPVVYLIALPLKIGHGDGAPARVIALEEKA